MALNSILYPFKCRLFPSFITPDSFFNCKRVLALNSGLRLYSDRDYHKVCLHRPLKINHLHNRLDVSSIKIQTRGFRGLRRRPIEVIRHDIKGKTFDEYLDESRIQEGERIQEEKEVHLKSIPATKDFRVGEKNFKKPPSPPKPEKARNEPLSNIHENKVVSNKVELKTLQNLTAKLYEKAPQKIKSLIEYGKSPRLRKKHDVFIVEGWRLFGEALQCGLKPTAIFYSRSGVFLNLIPQIANSEEELANFLNLYPLYKTPYSTFKLWSSLQTPPGIIAAFPLSSVESMCDTPKENTLPITVILDGIRDPNNIGSIIRTVTAAGVYKIVLTKGCCDIWDPKVLRSSCGANFYTHCASKVPWSQIESHLPSSHSLYLADACRELPEENLDVTVRSEEIECSDTLKELAIQETKNQKVYSVDETETKIILNTSFHDAEHIKKFEHVKLPQYFYCEHKLRFFAPNCREDQSIVLILGGETGLSNCAKKFALENGGVQLAIPMANGVESLNSSVATGILVYEMHKQYSDFVEHKKNAVHSIVEESV